MKTLLGFTPYWDYKRTKAILVDSPGVYTSDKIFYLNTTNKILLEFDAFDGSIVSGLRQLLFFSFVLDKQAGYKIFCKSETIHYEKIKQICCEY